MKFLSHFHDPDNLFVPILTELKNEIPSELNKAVVALTPESTVQIYELLKEMGFKIIDGGPYGVGRMAALKQSLKDSDDDHFFVCDFDKLLHWLKTNREEFLKIMHSSPTHDMLVIARSPKIVNTYPQSWLETEMIATKIIGKILHKNVDLLNGPYVINRKTAEIIAEQGKEIGVGACAEWCLLAHLNHLTIENFEVEGLTWEDPDRFMEQIKASPNFEEWKKKNYDSLYEWRKRVEFLETQVKVMIRLTSEPINPKFPVVKKQIFSNL